MNYIYVVSDDWHGVVGYYYSKTNATKEVNIIASEQYKLPLDTPLDYNSEDLYGWDGVASWRRESVVRGEG